MINHPVRPILFWGLIGVFLFGQCSAALAVALLEGQANSDPLLELWKLRVAISGVIVSLVGFIVALIAFFIGLRQYNRTQQWKRAEFLASEMKELLADPKAVNALTMIDWGARKIKLRSIDDPAEKERTLVTYGMQSEALLPHTFKSSPGGSAESTSKSGSFVVLRSEARSTIAPMEEAERPDATADGIGLRSYSSDEALIRDCYDGLLDRFDRLGSYLETGLMSASDLEPYVGYYIHEIAAPTRNPTEALWSVTLLTYVHFYHYIGVITLFEMLGHDISPGGSIFEGFVDNIDQSDLARGKKLHEAAEREWETLGHGVQKRLRP